MSREPSDTNILLQDLPLILLSLVLQITQNENPVHTVDLREGCLINTFHQQIEYNDS